MNNRICPLLKDPENYTPDIQDLLSNEVERNYWLATLERTVAKFVDKAGELNPDNPKATEDAKSCLQKFQQLIEKIKSDPRERIDEIDLINDFNEKWLELIKGVLAGNVFDWGSEAVAKMLAEVPTFGLSHAMDTIEERPWFIDHVNLWIERLNSHTFKSAVIFVDNAGVDFVLGILPFIRELLTMGTRVILTANSYPSLNDVTYQELNLYCCSAAQQCNVLKDAISSGQLVTIENGQKGPCLDLKNIPSELCDLMVESDLIVLEGMGRSVHTNLNTEFAVDSIKIAVLKNEWLAKSLGANQFSVIFKYEPAV
ncbi:4'-phosphopantetheine phosphatase isoform X2 [Euwallacea fornicatus]|uniref:4'-phosphopantetheine phosphatase isoform X2 n=1 Tax=Euwallacea fornicatus TaxID=995702 RepID=UPI00338EA700